MNVKSYEQKINMLYNYLNNENFHENYEIQKININKIILSDIELPEGKDSNEILQYILKQNLQYLFTIGDDVYFKVLSNNIATLMKICIHPNKLLLNDNLVSYLLSELVLERKTNNILLPIVNINVNLLDLKTLLKSTDNLPIIYDSYFDKNKKKIICVKVRECFYNLTTLRNYIETENNIDYKILLFNIIHTLEVIKRKYKNFGHNSLSLDNIFIYHKNVLNQNTILINGITYHLPTNNYEIKLTNFENTIVTNGEIELLNGVLNSIKNTNDLAYLAKDILKINKNIDLLTKNFLTKLRDMKNNNIETLSDNYFNEYIKNPSDKNKESYKGSRKLNTTFNLHINSENESVFGNQKLVRINKKSLKKQLIGGAEKNSIPPYNAEKNNPFRTNDQKNTFNKKQDDVNKPRMPPVLVEQTIYDTHASKFTPPVPPPVYVPIYDHNNQQMSVPFASHALNPSLSQPVIKQYNVSLANPLHDFRTVSRLYEDVLPGDPRSFTFTTVYERKQLINFIRNLLNNNTDGEDMILTGGKNSLLSSMKLLDLNPYSINQKPHMDLARNFLIFRAAYPIRYDKEKNNVNPSKSAHGINVRIYNFTIGEMVGNEINQNLSNFDFDMWRELHFYKYILDNIIEKKISPNFISFILTKKDKLSNVNWSKLDTLQNRKKEAEKLDKKLIAFKKQNNPSDDVIKLLYINNIGAVDTEFIKIKNTLSVYPSIKIVNIDPMDVTQIGLINKYNITSFPNILFKFDNKHIKYDGNILIDDIITFINSSIVALNSLVDLRKSSGESLILLTEAPHSNIIKWASPMYESAGALKTMIATGFHKSEVWNSILFQIMHILYVLQENEIYFEELSLENNIYIKDIYYDPNTINYWIYNINGLNYYVPNYGYLVLFDSKYNDLESGNYKIRSPKLFPNKNDKINSANDLLYNYPYKTEIFNQFKNIFEPSIFSSQLKKMGCLEPDNVILDLLRNISNDATPIIDIGSFIKKYYSKYLNNRIGKHLTRQEKEMINILNRPTFNKTGELLIKQERYDEYKWILFDSSVNNMLKNIINKDIVGNISNEQCNSYSLLAIPPSEKINPFGIEENKIIETYK